MFSQYSTGLTPEITYASSRRIGALGAYVVMIDLKEKKFRQRLDQHQLNELLTVRRGFAQKALSLRSRRKHKAWGVSPRYRGQLFVAREAGDSTLQISLSPVITGSNWYACLSWGSRPRLYAHACFAG